MLKIIGALIVIVATTTYGFYRSSLYIRRVEQLKQLIYAFTHLKSDIQFSYTPLPEAFELVSRTLQKPFNRFFIDVSTQLQQGRVEESFQSIWSRALEDVHYDSVLTSEQYDILQRLGYVLGISDIDDQIQHLQLTIDRLILEQNNAIDEQTKYATLWRNLGALSGVALVILLI